MAHEVQRNWLITGVSSGFGRYLAEAALARGDTVVGTVRQAGQVAAFEALCPGRAHAVLLDVTDRARIGPAVVEAADKLGGRLDILVNNAGYGLMGAAEELDDDQIDAVIATNLHGTIFTTRAALPLLRESRGIILNFSSMVGYVGVPGVSAYCAAKFGVEGFTEALRGEMAPFGVTALLVEPGSFRTNFGAGSAQLTRTPMAVYDGTPAAFARGHMAHYAGTELGDPVIAARVILQALDQPSPPFRILLGTDAVQAMRGKISALEADVAACEAAAVTTDYAVEAAAR